LYQADILTEESDHISGKNPLPWWTWVLPLFIFFAGTQISLWSKVTTGSSLFYFPGPLALIFTYWWGPRVLVSYYINSVLCAGFWGLDKVALWPVYGLPEVVFVFLSWLFFIKLARGKCWLPDIRQVIYFLIGGILIPLVIYKFFLETIFLLTGDIPKEKFWHILVTTGLGDFISVFGLSVPVLYFLTQRVSRAHLLYRDCHLPDQVSPIWEKFKSNGKVAEVVFLALLVGYMSTVVNFGDYWFMYGIISLYVAIRFGFGNTLIFNSYILIVTYIVPSIFETGFSTSFILDDEKLKIQLGSTLLFVFSAITGRVMTDTEKAEQKLSRQNLELDRF
jgi:hypothetical protein